ESSLRAEMKMIGIWSVERSANNSPVTSQPEMPGIMTSSRIMSGCSARTQASASSPSRASSTRKPASSRLIRQSALSGPWSSTTSTVLGFALSTLTVTKPNALTDQRQPRASRLREELLELLGVVERADQRQVEPVAADHVLGDSLDVLGGDGVQALLNLLRVDRLSLEHLAPE